MEVSDDELKMIKSVLTVVDGKIIRNKLSSKLTVETTALPNEGRCVTARMAANLSGDAP